MYKIRPVLVFSILELLSARYFMKHNNIIIEAKNDNIDRVLNVKLHITLKINITTGSDIPVENFS